MLLLVPFFVGSYSANSLRVIDAAKCLLFVSSMLCILPCHYMEVYGRDEETLGLFAGALEHLLG